VHCADQFSIGQRLKDAEEETNPRQRPYRVHRWRFKEHDVSSRASSRHPDSLPDEPRTSIYCPSHGTELRFPTDNLIHLIHYNVFRALISNKRILDLLTASEKPFANLPVSYHSNWRCLAKTTIHAVHFSIPVCLVPTVQQMSNPHSFWIDILPFPQLRDNLIKWETCFDHWEFLQDLVGGLLNDAFPDKPNASGIHPLPALLVSQGEAMDETTADRRGLIVWGEPHDKDNWEATPGFLAKWAWILEGCRELVEISNRWRVKRGEEPMAVPAP
jgi:hypothetical protein